MSYSLIDNTKINYELLNKLKTGDLLFFHYERRNCLGWFSQAIEYFTNSKWSHIAMVLKNPTFLEKKLNGIYIWESSWNGTPDPQDGKIKLGVQITPIQELFNEYENTNGYIYVRQIDCNPKLFCDYNLKRIHNVVYDKPYDIVPSDWIEAIFRKDSDPKKTGRFWCSALVGYIYNTCGLIQKTTDWSVLRPSDFSSEQQTVEFVGHAHLLNEKKLYG